MQPGQKESVVVVIPVYKSTMTAYEEIAFEQALHVLHKHPILLVAPHELDISEYMRFGRHLEVKRFKHGFFEGIGGYNRLLLSKQFYDEFRLYDYLLIYQLDAFVFSDLLTEWCNRGFDYIGAPWIDEEVSGYHCVERNACRIRNIFPNWMKRRKLVVGNGGLSLRKISTFRRCLRILHHKARRWPYNEDFFWGVYVPSYIPFFRVPTFETALEFSFEMDPSRCYRQNGYKLPFGCHAWEKYDPEFWKPFFQQFGYTL